LVRVQVGPPVKSKGYRDVALFLFPIVTHLLHKQRISKHITVFYFHSIYRAIAVTLFEIKEVYLFLY